MGEQQKQRNRNDDQQHCAPLDCGRPGPARTAHRDENPARTAPRRAAPRATLGTTSNGGPLRPRAPAPPCAPRRETGQRRSVLCPANWLSRGRSPNLWPRRYRPQRHRAQDDEHGISDRHEQDGSATGRSRRCRPRARGRRRRRRRAPPRRGERRSGRKAPGRGSKLRFSLASPPGADALVAAVSPARSEGRCASGRGRSGAPRPGTVKTVR